MFKISVVRCSSLTFLECRENLRLSAMAEGCRFVDQLVRDTHEYLRWKENQLPHYVAQSPQLSVRRYLVDWLAIVSEKFAVQATSRHLAVALLDYFMDRFSITEQQLKLVVIGCLLIACKLEEQEINIPKSTTLNQFVPAPGYTPRDYLSVELTILQAMNWDVHLPTGAHFIDYYLCCGVTPSDLHHGAPLDEQTTMAKDYLHKYCTYFLEVSLQDQFYRQWRPSLVAASCIASSRLCLGISPVWTGQLQHTSTYTWGDMQAIVNAMLHTHKMDAQGNTTTIAETQTPSLPTTPTSSPTTVVSPGSTDQGYHSLTHTPGSPLTPT